MQSRQLTADVYHHSLVKLYVTPSTVDCWGKTLYPTYPICTILHSNKFSLHFLVHFTLYMQESVLLTWNQLFIFRLFISSSMFSIFFFCCQAFCFKIFNVFFNCFTSECALFVVLAYECSLPITDVLCCCKDDSRLILETFYLLNVKTYLHPTKLYGVQTTCATRCRKLYHETRSADWGSSS